MDLPRPLSLSLRAVCRRRQALACMGAGLLPGPAARAAGVQLVRHGLAPDATGQPNYRAEVLRLVLERSKPRFGPYALEYTGYVPQSRAFGALEQGSLDLCAAMTSITREASALPVRYCLYRGLLGLRIGLGRPETVRQLDGVDRLDALREVTLGLVHDWPDYSIQRQAGLQVLRLADVRTGVQQLRRGGFQLIPFGAVEAEDMARQFELSMITSWALAYPTAFYFFVAPSQPVLARRLAHGFEVAMKDGSLDALFTRQVERRLTSTHVERRRVFALPNPLLPPATPLERVELWHPLMRKLSAAAG